MLALYHNDMSSCAQKVRLMLAEKGLEWESRHLDLRAGEHQKDWYVKLNPRAVVPTLIDGDIVVPESNVINEYLDERFPDPPQKPADPFGRARMRLWTKQLDEGVHDAGIAILSFGRGVPASVHYPRRGRQSDAGKHPRSGQARAPPRRDREGPRIRRISRSRSSGC